MACLVRERGKLGEHRCIPLQSRFLFDPISCKRVSALPPPPQRLSLIMDCKCRMEVANAFGFFYVQ